MRLQKYLAAGIVAAAIVLPLVSSAEATTSTSTSADVKAQIQALLDQIHALQLQLKALIASSTASGALHGTTTNFGEGDHGMMPAGQMGKMACVTLSRNLGIGSHGDDVMKLQQMLADDPETEFKATATGFFGPMTARAMMKFQMHMGIASSSDGRVGPLTRGFFERSCGKGLENEHGTMMKGGAISGTITVNIGSSITIQNKQGTSRIVNVSATTTIQVWVSATSSPTTGTIADLIVGKMAAAEGTPNSDGSINAKHIKVGPAMPPKPEDSGADWKRMHASSTEDTHWNMQTPPPPQGALMGRYDNGGY